jgi:hypothetical protein
MSNEIMQDRVTELLKSYPQGLTIPEIANALDTTELYIRDVIRGMRKVKHPTIQKDKTTYPARYKLVKPVLEVEYTKLAQLQKQLLESIAIVNSIPDISKD